jgi:undecaprenyl-diphosphatase
MRKNSLFLTCSLLVTELVVGVMAIILCLSLLLTFSRNFLTVFDLYIIHWIYSFRSDSLTLLMKTFTFFGGEMFLITGILLLLICIWERHRISSFSFTFLLVFGTVINLLLKDIFHRHRPDYMPLVHELTYSFPSGHSMNSFIFYTCLAYFIIRNTKNNKIKFFTIICTASIILLIGLSRVYLGAHYPSDVIAGYIAGMLWFFIILLVEKTAHYFKLFKKVL